MWRVRRVGETTRGEVGLRPSLLCKLHTKNGEGMIILEILKGYRVWLVEAYQHDKACGSLR